MNPAWKGGACPIVKNKNGIDVSVRKKAFGITIWRKSDLNVSKRNFWKWDERMTSMMVGCCGSILWLLIRANRMTKYACGGSKEQFSCNAVEALLRSMTIPHERKRSVPSLLLVAESSKMMEVWKPLLLFWKFQHNILIRSVVLIPSPFWALDPKLRHRICSFCAVKFSCLLLKLGVQCSKIKV